MIPYATQSISDEDIQAVVDVLRSPYLTQGPLVARFESAVCEYTGAPHAAAVSSATAALHLACLALDAGPRSRVWTSPITFVASANAALYCGAEIGFVDIDPATGLMDLDRLESRLEAASRNGNLPDILIPVHFAGQACDMQRIHVLAGRYGFRVIEDASHAIGGTYLNERIGSCEFSDLTVFSFHAIKNMTTGEGGMVMTRNAQLHARISLLRTHGITRDPERLTGDLVGPWVYEQHELGFNYRITDFQCALGLSQLQRLDRTIERRRSIADLYDRFLSDCKVHPLARNPSTLSAWHLYVIRTADPLVRAALHHALRDEGIGSNVHYIPVHLQPYYKKLGFRPGDFPLAESYYSTALSLPMHNRLSDDDIRRAADIVRKVAGRNETQEKPC